MVLINSESPQPQASRPPPLFSENRTSPPTSVCRTRPETIRPPNGVFLLFDRKSSARTVQRVSGSMIVTTATQPGESPHDANLKTFAGPVVSSRTNCNQLTCPGSINAATQTGSTVSSEHMPNGA